MTADELEDEVLNWLSQQNVGLLDKVYQLGTVTCKDEWKGKKSKLLKGLLSHMTSLSDEDAESLNMKIYKFFTEDLDTKPKMPALEGDDAGIKTEAVVEETLKNGVGVLRLKECKINGTIFGKSENKLSFSNLRYQVENARKSKLYSDTSICGAIISAISSTSDLRTYFENKEDLTSESLLQTLRKHFKETKDSAAVYTEMSTAVQKSDQSPMAFVTQLLCLKQKIITLSKEENCPYNEKALSQRLYKSMFTGLRNPNIRNELRELCNIQHDAPVPNDEVLMGYVAEVSANETEREEKLLSAKKVSIDANAVTMSTKSGKAEKSKENPFELINELRTNQEKTSQELKSLRSEYGDLKSIMAEVHAMSLRSSGLVNNDSGAAAAPNGEGQGAQGHYNGGYNQGYQQQGNRGGYGGGGGYRGGGRGGGRSRGGGRCENCVRDNVFRCIHCLRCKSTEHRVANCPENPPNV